MKTVIRLFILMEILGLCVWKQCCCSQFVMTASASRGLLSPTFVTSYLWISLRCHGMLYCNAVSVCTLVANTLVFVKYIDCHIHSSLSLLVAITAVWLDECCLCFWMKVWAWERPWALVGAFTNFGSWGSLDNHRSAVRSCLERFAVGLKRSSASLCFWVLQGLGWKKDSQCHCIVSLQ